MKDSTLEIEPGQVHLWFVAPEEVTDPSLLASYQALLNEPERARQQRFVFAVHRHQYLVSRALLRTLLARYLGCAGNAVTFHTNRYGKPALPEELNPAAIRFNLSHTEGLIALGITSGSDIGVDVESLTRDQARISHDPDGAWSSDRLGAFFSPLEVRALRAVPEEQRNEQFYAYWTLKESYLKATGLGLSLALDQFSFAIAATKLAISFANPGPEDAPAAWQFALLRPTSRHCAAVALHGQATGSMKLRFASAIPLVSERPTACTIVATTPSR